MEDDVTVISNDVPIGSDIERVVAYRLAEAIYDNTPAKEEFYNERYSFQVIPQLAREIIQKRRTR
jgi:hypothetical protein